MSADAADGNLSAGLRRRWALIAGVVLAVAWPFVLAGPAAWRTASQLLALVLVGLSLTVTVGWLRVIALFAPAAAVAGAGATIVLVGGGHPVLAFAGAAVAGAATGLLALAPASANPRRWLPVTSLVLTAASVLVMPRLFRPVTPSGLFGVDLTDDRVLYLVGLAVVIAACAGVARLRRSPPGRHLAGIGTDDSAEEPQRWWVAGVALSGSLAGAAGYLTALLHHGVPSPMEFAPTTAVAYLVIPFVGGASTVGGAIVGAVVFLTAARTSLALGLASVTLPAVLLVVAVAVRHDGLVAWVRGRAGHRR